MGADGEQIHLPGEQIGDRVRGAAGRPASGSERTSQEYDLRRAAVTGSKATFTLRCTDLCNPRGAQRTRRRRLISSRLVQSQIASIPKHAGLILQRVNRNKILRVTSFLSDSLVIHSLIHEGVMSGSDSKTRQKDYRKRLRESGRKEILLDLPVSLIAKLDKRKSKSGKRSALVEKILEEALSGNHQEAV